MSVRTSASLVVLCPLAFAAACDGGGLNDPADLVGTWRQIPNQVTGNIPPEQRDILNLTADGAFELMEDTGLDVGTYTADDRDLTIIGGGDTFRMQYVVTADRLIVGALLPAGDVDGLVGTWAGDAAMNTEEMSLVVDLRADATAHWERDSNDDTRDETYDGTWSIDVDDVVITIEVPSQGGSFTLNVHFQQLPGKALGAPLFERI